MIINVDKSWTKHSPLQCPNTSTNRK